MSTNQPPTWGSPPPPQPGQPEWLISQATPATAHGGGRRRGAIIGATAAALALIAGGGAFAAYQFLDAEAQPADALPGDAIAYTRIDLDPTAGQKVAMFSLLRRLPQFEEQTGISSDQDDLRALVVERFLGDSECDELTFDADFASWVGNRAGFAVVPVDGEPQPVVSIQVTDQGKAEDAVDALSACSNLASAGDDSTSLGAAGDGIPEDSGIEFVGDYMLIAQSQILAEKFASQAESAPLSEDDRFSAAMAQLGEQGVASFWADVDGLREELGVLGDPQVEGMASALADVHSYSGVVRAGTDYLELTLATNSDTTLARQDGNPIEELPGTTLGAFSMSQGGDLVDRYWGQLESFADQLEPGGFDRGVSEFEQESGLLLPEDLRTLLGDNITAALDGAALDLEAISSPEDLADIGFGVRFSSDPVAMQDVLDRVQEKINAAGSDFEFITHETEDGIVVATNAEFAQTLAATGDLGDSDAFTIAVPEAQEAVSVFYLDLDKAYDVVTEIADAEALSVLEPMRSFGVTIRPGDDGYTEATVRLAFN